VRLTTALFIALLASSAAASDDLTSLSDEFNDASTLAQWQRVYVVEGWDANQLELQDINTTRAGRMVMMPFTSTWFNDYRGELTFKEVQGDFVVTADVEATARNGTGPPSSSFSLAGLMVRTPRQITPATWHSGGENYVFLSLGAADRPPSFQFEVKTTVNSISTLSIDNNGASHAVIQLARIGPYVIALKKVAGVWSVHHRYYRPDFPLIMQVGMTTYTDYQTCSMFAPFIHNSTVIHSGHPDLIGSYDYIRFRRPNVPASLANVDLTNTSLVSDATLLSFLGGNADVAAPNVGKNRAVRH
jgi:hypothetical protein